MRLVTASTAQVPGLYCPIARFGIEPYDTVSETCAWIERFGLCESRRREAYAEAGAWFAIDSFPFADRLGQRLMARWSVVTFIFDDDYCEPLCSSVNPSKRGRLSFDNMANCLIDVLDHPNTPPMISAPLTRAMADFAADVVGHYPREVLTLIADGWRRFVRGQRWQIALRGKVPSLSDFFEGRIDNVAIWLTTVLAAAGMGLDLADESWRNPAVQAMIYSGWSLPMIYNEWASYDKELDAGTSNINLVDVVSHQFAIGLDDAVIETARLHDRIMTVFLALTEKCEAQNELLARWAQFMRAAVIGNIIYHARISRYGWPPLGQLVLLDCPCLDIGTIAIPETIRWWWREAGLLPVGCESS
ncbi:hypothetical protein JMUB6875_51660 [Nocardia sp. JMUB6875]|uniref:terpene synthase family protein n=1 Tax=Nocardia sp. JMUB6875 TaxID=3158170 RepID=UPI0032E79D8B